MSEKIENAKTMIDFLTQPTAKKDPGTAPTHTWTFDETKNPATELSQTQETAEAPEVVTNPKTGKKLTPDEIRQSAEATTAGVELFTSNLAGLAIYLKYKFKYTGEENEMLEGDILDKPFDTLTDKEKIVVNKYHRLQAEKEKREKRIETDLSRRKKLEAAFRLYTETTGETFLTPKTSLGIQVGESIVNALMSALM